MSHRYTEMVTDAPFQRIVAHKLYSSHCGDPPMVRMWSNPVNGWWPDVEAKSLNTIYKTT